MGIEDRRLIELERVMVRSRRKWKTEDKTVLLRKRVRVANVGVEGNLRLWMWATTYLVCCVTGSQFGFKLRANVRTQGKKECWRICSEVSCSDKNQMHHISTPSSLKITIIKDIHEANINMHLTDGVCIRRPGLKPPFIRSR
jgi:hypothetical protein